jgi:hypothetical protein
MLHVTRYTSHVTRHLLSVASHNSHVACHNSSVSGDVHSSLQPRTCSLPHAGGSSSAARRILPASWRQFVSRRQGSRRQPALPIPRLAGVQLAEFMTEILNHNFFDAVQRGGQMRARAVCRPGAAQQVQFLQLRMLVAYLTAAVVTSRAFMSRS